MAEQPDQLAEVSGLPNVSCGWPRSAPGAHPGVTGPFVILRSPVNGDGREGEPATVYKDGFTGAPYLDKPHEVERYTQAFGRIRGMCLDEDASRSLIQQAAEELRK